MVYFNGELHGWNNPLTNEYEPPKPCTVKFCDNCAKLGAVPLDETKRPPHTGTGFKWAPRYGGGATCDICRAPI